MKRILFIAAATTAVVVAVVGAQQQQQTPPPPPADSAQSAAAAPRAGAVEMRREVFTYSARGRRDPFVSLMTSNEIRPLIQDIELMGIIFDPSGGNSQATLRDLTDATRIYRVKVGQTLGRMTVSEITARDVEFTIDEFGFSRRERLLLKPDTTTKRTP